MEINDDESLPENFHTYDDSELFSHEDHVGQSRTFEPLMPESVKDEIEALEHFTKVFRDRYGECHPVFYIGSLDNAIRDSLFCSAKERKQLAIYLHHDGSILSNVFCSHTLCNEGVVNFLTSNFIIWAWDMTLDTNHARLTTLATHHFGSVAATQIRGYSPDNFPVLFIISRSRMTNKVADVIRDVVTVNELMSRLIQDQEVFSEQQQKDVVKELNIGKMRSMKTLISFAVPAVAATGVLGILFWLKTLILFAVAATCLLGLLYWLFQRKVMIGVGVGIVQTSISM